MYKRPQAEIEAALEEATKVYDFDENDKMAWSKLVCFWFADEVVMAFVEAISKSYFRSPKLKFLGLFWR